MKIAWGWLSILICSWQSKSDLTKLIDHSAGGLLIGESTEQDKEFYSATVTKELANHAHPLVIGICSEGCGVAPQLLTVPGLPICFIGVNSEVFGVDVEARQVVCSIDLSYSFRNMLHLPGKNLILAFHETGACAFREDGVVIWNFSEDVLLAAHLEADNLHFEFMDSEPIMIDVENGTPIVPARRDI